MPMAASPARAGAAVPDRAPAHAFYDPATLHNEESVGLLMRRVMLSVVQQVDRRLGPCGLTNAQWGPLMRLRTAGPCTVVELARWVQTDPGATTRLLDRLEKKGLCRRVRSSEDRRVVKVEITPAGEAAIANVPAVLCDVLNAHLAGFSEPEWHTLKTLLARMAANGDAQRTGEP